MVLEKYASYVYHCSQCGWCRLTLNYDLSVDKVCPVYENYSEHWESLTAKGKIILAKALLEDKIQITSDVVELASLCTTCGKCRESCMVYLPSKAGYFKKVEIDTVKIIEAMRAEICERDPDLLPQPYRQILEKVRIYKNPYAEPIDKRLAWLPSNIQLPNRGEVVYFAGCTSPYRQPEICTSTIKVLHSARVHPAVVDEWCCGSTLIRTGQWDYVETLAKHNAEELKKAGAKRIVTSCAGCYRTFKIDYPEILGNIWDFEVLHVAEFIEKLIEKGTFKIHQKLNMKVTYHDPCHLGRHCGVYDAPRNVLNSIPGIELIEMPSTRNLAMCCGAGGGLKALFNDLAVRIGMERVKAAETVGAEALTSACPFCKRNLVDAIKTSKANLEFYDLSEILARFL